MIPSIFAELGIAMTLLVAACGVTWFASEAHYKSQLAEFEGQVRGAAEAQKIAVAKQKAADDAVSQEISNEAQQQIGSMASVISDLSVRLQQHPVTSGRTGPVRAPAPSPAIACVEPKRPATAAGDHPVPATEGPAAARTGVVVDRDVLLGILTVGEDALRSEVLAREYFNRTGQVPNGKPSN